MAAHHQQALFILARLSPDVDPAVTRLAQQIDDVQRTEIGVMLGWLRLAGAPPNSRTPMAWMEASPSGAGDSRHHPATLDTETDSMPGMATTEELEKLSSARGLDAEVLFLQLMERHHRGGIAMAQAADALLESGPVKQSRPRHDQHPESGIRADDADARTTWGTTTALTRMCSDYHRCRPANYRRNRHFIMTLLVRGIDWSKPDSTADPMRRRHHFRYDLLHSRLGAAILRRRDEGAAAASAGEISPPKVQDTRRATAGRRSPQDANATDAEIVRGSPRFIRHTSAARTFIRMCVPTSHNHNGSTSTYSPAAR